MLSDNSYRLTHKHGAQLTLITLSTLRSSRDGYRDILRRKHRGRCERTTRPSINRLTSNTPDYSEHTHTHTGQEHMLHLETHTFLSFSSLTQPPRSKQAACEFGPPPKGGRPLLGSTGNLECFIPTFHFSFFL